MTDHGHPTAYRGPYPIRDHRTLADFPIEHDDFGIWCEPPREDLRVTQARWDAEASLIAKWGHLLASNPQEARRASLGMAVGSFSLIVWTFGLWAIFG